MAKTLGEFQCAKITLMGLNIFYILVGIVLICIGSKFSHSNQVTGLPIVGGVVACGVFLILISIMGVYGAARHHQVLLFFYMLILIVVFIIQFSVACACLAVSEDTQRTLAADGWDGIGNQSRTNIQDSFDCCKFNDDVLHHHDYPPCPPQCLHDHDDGNDPTTVAAGSVTCATCDTQILKMIKKGFQIVGGVSLFFSFTEIIGAVAAYRYRNMYGRNPLAS